MIDVRLPLVLAACLLLPAGASASPELARSKNCVACHHVERKMNGPAFKAVAERYGNQDGAVQRLTEKVRAGGVGVWGPSPMPPQPSLSQDDAEALVKWILSLR